MDGWMDGRIGSDPTEADCFVWRGVQTTSMVVLVDFCRCIAWIRIPRRRDAVAPKRRRVGDLPAFLDT